MSKKNVNYVPQALILAVAEKLGCSIEHQKGFTKITGTVPNRAVYPANGKLVGRIDVSGFIHPSGVVHPKPPTKRVAQCVDMTLSQPEILKALYRILKDGLMSASSVAQSLDKKGAVAEPTKEEVDAELAKLMAEMEPAEAPVEEPAAEVVAAEQEE